MLRIFSITFLAILLIASTASGQTTTTTNGGAFDKLSPGNQKIAQSLFDAQPSGSPTPMSRDDIAAMKQGGKGWGEVFKEMKSQGLVQEKNLGQVVSKYGQRSQPGELGSKPGRSHSNDTAGPGRGYGHGQSSEPGASAGRSGASQGGGKGK